MNGSSADVTGLPSSTQSLVSGISSSSILLTSSVPSIINDTNNRTYPVIACDLEYAECQAQRYLWIAACFIILLFGTIGNILIILVMSRKQLRRTAFGCYLIAIAITDTLCIWVALSRHLIKNLLEVDIREEHYVICWLQRFLLYGSANSSVWLLTAVTFERTFSIYAPTRSIKFKSLSRTKMIIAFILITQYGWNTVAFFTRGAEYSEDGSIKRHCGYKSDASKYYWDYIHLYIAMADYSILPFIAMLTMNIAIFVRLRKRDKMYKECATLTNADCKAKTSSVSSKTLMLLPVTIFFIATTLPSLVFTAVELSTKTEGHERAKMELADFFFSLLMYLNHSANFVLYCVTGRLFRQSCWRLVTRCCKAEKERRWETQYTRSPMTIYKRPYNGSTINTHSSKGSHETTPVPTPISKPRQYLSPHAEDISISNTSATSSYVHSLPVPLRHDPNKSNAVHLIQRQYGECTPIPSPMYFTLIG